MSNTGLKDVLRQSSNEDLEPLVEYLTKPITETLSMEEGYQNTILTMRNMWKKSPTRSD